MSEMPVILLLGASSAVGGHFLDRVSDRGIRVLAVSRHAPPRAWSHAVWVEHDLESGPADVQTGTLVSFGPVGHALMQARNGGLGRVIALSSVSPMFKRNSADTAERSQMAQIEADEVELRKLCEEQGIALTILKTTMIHAGSDGMNVGRIAGLSDRLPVLPYAGKGLRAPVHADDIARLALDCLRMGEPSAGTWLLGGGETLAYPDMLRRIAAAQGRSIRLLRLPALVLKLALRLAQLTGRLRDISPAMIDRQAMDLVVDDQPAREHLGWSPRPFRPGS